MGLKAAPGTRRYLATLAPTVKRTVRQALRRIEADPYDNTLDLKVLDVEGPERVLRCRVGPYRIVYAVRADHTYIHRVMHRREGYGWLERL